VDPARDIEIINTELALRDLGIVTNAISRTEKLLKSGDKKAAAALEAYQQVAKPLDQGRPARTALPGLPPAAQEALKSLNLLTSKPVLYVANVNERDAEAGDAPGVSAVKAIAAPEGAPVVLICGAIEAQISALESDTERQEYMEAVGLSEPGLNRLIRAGYDLLGLITFFTVGPKEDRAWTVARGATAPKAAGTIHSDFERGFIRAEVIGYDDFLACRSEAAAREKGKLRLEGKEYLVQDGDLMHFRFSV
jgi:GTP-binding protein YchF